MKSFKIFYFIITLTFISCNDAYIPKPFGFFRVDLPLHQYHKIDTLNLPYHFELSNIAKIVTHSDATNDNWIDIQYPYLNASIYCSYIQINNNIFELSEDARKFVYKHSIKADGIGEKTFENPQKKVYGLLYDINGNTASSIQFVLTDSTKHFFRGVLYFNNVPNKDSIAPMNNFIREDILRIMESFEWKK
jgi:gliding motility-associated lipoprotein GldD